MYALFVFCLAVCSMVNRCTTHSTVHNVMLRTDQT